MTTITRWTAASTCWFAGVRLFLRPPTWKRTVMRTPAKIGRLRAGQLDRFCSLRWLDRVATDDFVPLNWLSARTPVARDAAAIIRRAR